MTDTPETPARSLQDELVEALAMATYELNAIRARDGAPQHIDWYRGQPVQTDSCTHEFWDELTERCFAALKLAGADMLVTIAKANQKISASRAKETGQ